LLQIISCVIWSESTPFFGAQTNLQTAAPIQPYRKILEDHQLPGGSDLGVDSPIESEHNLKDAVALLFQVTAISVAEYKQ